MSMAAVLGIAGVARAAPSAQEPRSQPSSSAKVLAEKAWLGVSCRVGSHGVLVEEVIPLTPAAAAGIRVGDQIFSIEGQVVSSPVQLKAVIQQYSVGDEVEVRVWRDDGKRSLSATLARELTGDETFDRRWRDRPAPELSFEIAYGEAPASSAAMLGDVVVMALLGSDWLSVDNVERFNTMVARHGDDGLIVSAALKRDDGRQIGELARSAGALFSIVRDVKGELRETYLRDYRADGPLFVVIDRDGIVRFVGIGAEALPEVELAVAQALRERNGIDLD